MAEINSKKTRTRRHKKKRSTASSHEFRPVLKQKRSSASSSELRPISKKKSHFSSSTHDLRPVFRTEAHKTFRSESNMMREPHLFIALRTEYGSLQRKYGAVISQNKEYEKQIQQLQHENSALKQQLSVHSPRSPHSQSSVLIPDFSEDHNKEIENLQKTNRKYMEFNNRLKSKNSVIREENERLWMELRRVNEKNEVISAENAQRIEENNRLQSKNKEIEQENCVIQKVHRNHLVHYLKETSLLQEQIQRLRHKEKEASALVLNDLNKSEQLNAMPLTKVSVKNDVISEFSDDDFDEMQALLDKCGRTLHRISWNRRSASHSVISSCSSHTITSHTAAIMM